MLPSLGNDAPHPRLPVRAGGRSRMLAFPASGLCLIRPDVARTAFFLQERTISAELPKLGVVQDSTRKRWVGRGATGLGITCSCAAGMERPGRQRKKQIPRPRGSFMVLEN